MNGGGYADRLHDFTVQQEGEFIAAPRASISQMQAEAEISTRDAQVRIDTCVVYSGQFNEKHQRVRATYLLGDGPDFFVRRAARFDSIGRALGLKKVTLGDDRAFDKRLLVATSDAVRTRTVWIEPARRIMVSHADSFIAHAADSMVIVTYPFDGVRDPQRLGAAVDLVGHLASFGIDRFSELRALPEAEYCSPTGRFGERTPPSVRLRIGTATVEYEVHGPHVTCTAQMEREHAPLNARFEAEDALTREQTAGLPDLSRVHLLAAIPGHITVGDGRASFTLHGPLDAGRLMAAARLVVHIARGSYSQGAFR